MIRIAEFFNPDQSSLIQLVRQCGIEDAVGCMDWSRGLEVPDEALPWSFNPLKQQQQRYRELGFKLEVL